MQMQENDKVYIEDDHFAEMSFHDRYFLAQEKVQFSWQFIAVSLMISSPATNDSNCSRHSTLETTRRDSETKKSGHCASAVQRVLPAMCDVIHCQTTTSVHLRPCSTAETMYKTCMHLTNYLSHWFFLMWIVHERNYLFPLSRLSRP